MDIKAMAKMLEYKEPFETLCDFIEHNQTNDAIKYIEEYCKCSEETAKALFVDFKVDYDEIFDIPSNLSPSEIARNNAEALAWLNKPKCPICGSTNLSKITTTKKVAKIAMFGIFGMGDNGKTWKCNNCGSKF